MRVVYFVQSHDAPEQLGRLVERLRAPRSGSLVLIGHDASQRAISAAELPHGDDIEVRIGTCPVRRGELSCLEPYLEACRWLVERRIPFDWLVYLSGRDYPVRPVAAIERDLEALPWDAAIRTWDVMSPASPWGVRRGRRRYFYRYRRLPDRLRWPLRLLKPLLRATGCELSFVYGVHLGVPARPPRFGPDHSCWGGYQWHSLRRAAVEYLVEATRPGQPILEYFRHTLVPDEALVQTVLVESGRFRLLDDNRRFADTHERPGGHARVLDRGDAARLTDGRYDFARRFDPVVSRELLDWLDSEVHRTAGQPAGRGSIAGGPLAASER